MGAVEKRHKFFLTFWLLLLGFSIYGQSNQFIWPISFDALERRLPPPSLDSLNKPIAKIKMLYTPMYNPNSLPIFCKMEHLIQKRSQIPVKIRLGDVHYVDKLESKH